MASHAAAESSSSLKGVSIDKLGPKLLAWAVGIMTAFGVFISFGGQFYATKGELYTVRESLAVSRAQLESNSKEIQELKKDQAVGFANMETRFSELQKILTSDRGR